jgi:hypothetical protein
MDIYLTSDITVGQSYYFVPDSATQAEGEALGYKKATWIVGDLTAANQQLAINQENYLNDPATANHFSCLKSIGQNPDGTNIWQSCDLNTEQPNTDVLYELFCDAEPGFQTALGLDQAKQVFANEQQALLVFVGLNQVKVLNSLPQNLKK